MYGVYAHPSQSGTFFAGGKYGIYKSTDGGATWLQIAYPSTTIIGVGVQTANPNVMIAGIASNQGVKYSTDGGANWVATNLSTGYMKDFAVSAANPGLMFLAMSGTSGSGLFTSSDGATWTAINPASSGQCYGVYVDPADADFILLGSDNGIFKSTDGGANWTNVQATGNFVRGIVKHDNKYFAVIYNGSVYESTNNGDTWTLANVTFIEKTWQAIGSSDAGALFGNWGSIFLGNGQTYSLSVQGLNNAYVHTTVYYADRNELWAGSEGSGIWVSKDMGETWENKSNGLLGWWAYSFSPTNHEDWQVNRMLVGTNNGVYVTNDFGENWNVLDMETTTYTGTMIDWTNPDMMWVGGTMGPVKFTTDGGTNWTAATGLPFALYPRFSLCKNTTDDLRVLLIYEQMGTTSYYSDDLGATFTASTGFTTESYFTDLSIRKAGNGLDQMVYMSTDKGIYKSADGAAYTICPQLTGLSWSVLGSRGTNVYAGAGNGVFHSADEGQTWEAFNQGISTIAIWDLVYGSSADVIYAGTRGYSVYKYGEEALPSYTLPFSQDFTGQQLPADWQNIDNAGNDLVWQFDNPGGRDITGAGFDTDFAILDSDSYGSGAAQDADLITPPIDCSSASNVVLKFDQSFRQYQTSVGTLSVSNNGTDWTAIYVIDVNNGYPNPAVTIEFDISEVAANQAKVWVKWNFIGDYDYWWAIDNISVTEGSIPGLDPPTNLEATVDLTNVTLTWNAPLNVVPLGYNVYRDNQLITLSAITETTYTDENVVAGTHIYSVTAVYDNGESTPAGPVQIAIDGTVGKIHGFVRDAVTNLTLSEATITAAGTDNGALTIMTPFGAYYSILLPAGNYDVTCTAEGYQPATVNNLPVVAGVNKGYTFYMQPTSIESITGIGTIGNDSYLIYPNPASDQLTIIGDGVTRCEILNQMGQQVYTANEIIGKQMINIESLPAGIYYIKVTTNQVTETQKLIVK